MKLLAVTDAFAICETIAEDRTRITQPGAYAAGYRTAATHIAQAIRAKREGHLPTQLERDLRDAEIEARTLARVVAAASDVVGDVGEDSYAADAVREVFVPFFGDEDLPPNLRRCEPEADESTVRLITAHERTA